MGKSTKHYVWATKKGKEQIYLKKKISLILNGHGCRASREGLYLCLLTGWSLGLLRWFISPLNAVFYWFDFGGEAGALRMSCHGLWWRLSDSPTEDTSVDGSPRCTRWLLSVNIPLTQCVRTLWGHLEKTDLKNFLCVGQGESGNISNSEQRATSHSAKGCSARTKSLLLTPGLSSTETKRGFNDFVCPFCPGKNFVWKKPQSET